MHRYFTLTVALFFSCFLYAMESKVIKRLENLARYIEKKADEGLVDRKVAEIFRQRLLENYTLVHSSVKAAPLTDSIELEEQASCVATRMATFNGELKESERTEVLKLIKGYTHAKGLPLIEDK